MRQLADLAMLDINRYMTEEILKALFEKPILTVINKQLARAVADDLTFGDRVEQLGVSLRDPIDLGKQAWLLVDPIKIQVTQLKGVGSGPSNASNTTVAFESRPRVKLGSRPTDVPSSSALEFSLADNIPTGFHLIGKGFVDLDYVRIKIRSALISFLNERYSKTPYTIGDVDLYQSGNKFVLVLSVVKRSDHKLKGKVYLWASPLLDVQNGQVNLRDVSFDVESANVLMKRAALAFRPGDSKHDPSECRIYI